MSTAASAEIVILLHAFWVALAVPVAAVVTATVAGILIQRRAVRRHEALCDAFTGGAGGAK